MGYYSRRDRRRKALEKVSIQMSETDPLVQFVNNAKDIITLTVVVAAALVSVSLLQRAFWSAFKGDMS